MKYEKLHILERYTGSNVYPVAIKVKSNQHRIVADVIGQGGTPDEDKVYATLFAESPDLLESLEQLSDWMREHTGPSDGTHEMLVNAVNVIAKAKGGAE